MSPACVAPRARCSPHHVILPHSQCSRCPHFSQHQKSSKLSPDRRVCWPADAARACCAHLPCCISRVLPLFRTHTTAYDCDSTRQLAMDIDVDELPRPAYMRSSGSLRIPRIRLDRLRKRARARDRDRALGDPDPLEKDLPCAAVQCQDVELARDRSRAYSRTRIKAIHI